ncbi:hypothetical protein KUTeg_008595 [Tegillarca granosa]|uniref:Uncharacterized protein n=1 Tax=Tegillarca granosa TaxID=220873 RepID=A0ABQ9F9J5_TEGGR|nr:hypothetical protein KUTeg_008595 [Tegillarca granosa]
MTVKTDKIRKKKRQKDNIKHTFAKKIIRNDQDGQDFNSFVEFLEEARESNIILIELPRKTVNWT